MTSGADIARKRPPVEGLPVVDAVATRRAPPPSGEAWVQGRLKEIAQLTKVGVPVTVVFDLDNTVFDTRHRTLFALHQFDAAHGTSHFADVTVADMAVDGRTTATQLGLDNDVVEAVAAHWDSAFWTPAHLVHDAPIAAMVDLVARAQAAGAQVKFLTGRVQEFHGASLAQLQKAGVDVAAADIHCKPDVKTRTAPFKEQLLKEWSTGAREIGFFVTEGVRDLEHVQGALPDVPLLRLDCTFEEDTAALARVPTWSTIF